MLLSIIGNILGNEDDDGSTDSENSDDPLADGNLAGGMSEESLMPGTPTNSGDGASDGSGGGMAGGSMDGGMDDDALFDDGTGSDDDLLGGDGMDGEPEFEMSDGGDAAFDGMDDEAGGVSSEIQARVEEMENEVGSLSSTVNTVQSENEQIGESLEEIEENIRKLLEVYEMVTQGVNPFVEGDSLSETFDGGAQGTGNFGGQSLFDGQDEADEEEEVDEDIASAEAEAFLDESLIDDEDDDEFDEFDSTDDDFEDDDLGEEEFDAMDDETDDGADDDLSFDELKSQYDSGDADWGAEGEPEEPAAADSELDDEDDPLADGEELDDPLSSDDALADPEDALEADDDAPMADDDALDAGLEAEDSLATDADEAVQEQSLPDPPWDDGGRPYLESIPSEYDTEFVVMDWLDYLVDEVGLNGAARTIRFYGSIRWIDSSVESYLRTTLNGFEDGPNVDDPEPSSALGVDHKRSLWWINRIATPEKKRVPFKQWLVDEGVADDPLHAAEPVADERSHDSESVANGDADPLESGDSDEFASDDSSSEMEISFTEESIDSSPGSGADRDPTEGSFDAEADGDSAALEVSSEDSIEEQDESRDARAGSARTIHIDESESNVASASTAERGRDDRPVVAERNAPDHDQRMIWVDSDVILSESGIELREPQRGHDEDEAGVVRPVVKSGGSSEARRLENRERESVKPVVERGGDTELERWQVELITSLFSAADEEPRR
ncbi:FlaD/FlaE family flagellar protein [Natrarchaeobius sp. A-rgal3]|uniref:FlaD/FlaE family flagellar protein n=1 Tax=Natrarchaeobius versutus TaxID=1679078 RepID=UPI003510314A